MAELDKATGDSGSNKQKLTKRKIALPLLLVIGLGAGVLIYFISKRQSSAAGAAAQTGLPYAVPSAQTPGNDGTINGLMSLVGNLGQQMDANFAQLQTQNAGLTTAMGKNKPTASPNPGVITDYMGQYHQTFVDALGNLKDQFYGGGSWHTQTLGTGLAPLSVPNVSLYNSQFQVVAPTATGGFLHTWYDPTAHAWGTDAMGGLTPGILSTSGPTANA